MRAKSILLKYAKSDKPIGKKIRIEGIDAIVDDDGEYIVIECEKGVVVAKKIEEEEQEQPIEFTSSGMTHDEITGDLADKKKELSRQRKGQLKRNFYYADPCVMEYTRVRIDGQRVHADMNGDFIIIDRIAETNEGLMVKLQPID